MNYNRDASKVLHLEEKYRRRNPGLSAIYMTKTLGDLVAATEYESTVQHSCQQGKCNLYFLTCSQRPEQGKQQAELSAHVRPQLKPASLWAKQIPGEALAK